MGDNIVVGYVADEAVPSEFMSCLLTLLSQRHDSVKGRVITVQGFAGRLDIGRHIVANAFLEKTDGAWLLMLDTDIIFDLKQFDQLVEGARNAEDFAVHSGVYARLDGTIGVWDWTDEGLAPVPPQTLGLHRYYEAGSVGLGFSLIPRTVLEDLQADGGNLPWFDMREQADGKTRIADDSSFFWRVRTHGFKLWVNTGVLVGHLKRVTMYPKLNVESELTVPKKEIILP